jgi:hypothetical protein
MAFAILAIIVTWFAIRRGQAWGLWAVSAAALVQVPYYAVITSIYAAQGAPLGGTVSLFPFVVGAIHRARLRSGRNATDAPGKIDSPILNTQRHVTTPPDHGRLRTKCVLVRQTFCLPSVEALPRISALTDSSSHYIGQNRQRL